MKLKCEFEIMEIGDELTAVPTGKNAEQFHGVLQLNRVGAKILEYIAECETPEEVHKKLCDDYPDDDKDDIGKKLCDFLNNLIREGILIP